MFAGLFSLSFLAPILRFFTGGFVGVITTAIKKAVEIVAMVVTWFVRVLLKGLDHTIKSPSAVAVLIFAMWVGYAYSSVVRPAAIQVNEVRKSVQKRYLPKRRSVKRPSRTTKPRDEQCDWFEFCER